jgi:monovalent cation:H+ antiporter-2, CPA2 family
MPHLNVFIADLALITAVAAVVTLLFSRLKLPVVLGYIIAGFLISPNVRWLP